MNQSYSGDQFTYFASIEDPDLLARHMKMKITSWRRHCGSSGLFNAWESKLLNYYGQSWGGNSSQKVTTGGSEGELSLIKVNDLHNLIQNQLVMVTSQRPAGIAKAANSDTQSQKASRIGTAIAEYYMVQGGYESKFVSAAETALLCDESYVELGWDKLAGDPILINPETGEPEMSGDPFVRIHGAWNVTRDPGLTIDQQKWYILTYRDNKFNLAARFPKFREQILSVKEDDLPKVPMNSLPEDSDAIFCHLLVHDRTPAVLEGRYSLLIGDTVVHDQTLPFKDFPVCRMTPADVIDGCVGYSSANDIMALEQVTDALYSIATTNLVTLGGQIIIAPQGGNLNYTDLGKGLRVFELPPDLVDKFKPMVLSKVSPETFGFITALNSKKEQHVGVNSVIRGQPEGQLSGSSGSALALIQTQGIAFNSGIQKSYFKLLSNVMTRLIGILAVYADTPRVARIVGKSKASGLKEFKYTGEDLGAISSIVYELVNPMSQTFGGKLQMAQDLLKAGQIKSPKQYINLVATGQMDVLTEDDEADGLLIHEENEWLMEGRPFNAIITQIHADHIKSHTSQITLEMQETDPSFVQRVLEHVQQHIDLWTQASISNPGILMATGQQPLMPPPPPPGMGPPLGALPPPPGSPPPGASKTAMPGSPAVKKAETVQEPNLPTVAGTDGMKPSVPGVT